MREPCLFAALAEFERGVIRERTLAGLRAALARGRTGGRPPCIWTVAGRISNDRAAPGPVATGPGARQLAPVAP